MLRASEGSVMIGMTLISDPQRGHIRGSDFIDLRQ
jgi:hypothetical protein